MSLTSKEPGPCAAFEALLQRNASAPAASWFERQLASLSPSSLPVALAGAGRRLGETEWALEQDLIEALGPGHAIRWPASDVARSVLLQCAVLSLAAEQSLPIVSACYHKGDNRERRALLRTLSLLPNPGQYVHLATEACRSHVQTVFEAIACDNPFPVSYFPELAFNQLVMKAFFTEAPVRSIWGLKDRLNPELRRMALDYAAERKAAGRAVPEDLSLVVGEQ